MNNVELRTNDYVIFKEIQGMKEINNCSPIKIKKIDNLTIQINDTSKFSKYTSGGVIMKAKIPLEYKFESFEKKLEEPYNEEEETPSLIAQISCNEIIHIGILSLYSFFEKLYSRNK